MLIVPLARCLLVPLCWLKYGMSTSRVICGVHLAEHVVLSDERRSLDVTLDNACRQITKEPSDAAAASSQQNKATGVEQQQPSAPGDFAASQQAPRGLSAQKQGLLQHTGLQSRAAQMVMQQRQAYLQPTSDDPSATAQKRSGT